MIYIHSYIISVRKFGTLPNNIEDVIALTGCKFPIKSWDGPKCLCDLFYVKQENNV